jgi:hypothetical protein
MSNEHLRKLFKQFIVELNEEIEDVEQMKEWVDEEFEADVDGRQIRALPPGLTESPLGRLQ